MRALKERFEMRLDQETLRAVDQWRTRAGTSRAEAIRQLIGRGLAFAERPPIRFSRGEALIISMLCDLLKGLELKSETNPALVQSALNGGQIWSLEQEYSALFRDDNVESGVVTEVTDVLDMWDQLESAHQALSRKERQKLAIGSRAAVSFAGFDANARQYGVARFMIDNLHWFPRFKGRDINSHGRVTIESYRGMLEVFLPIRKKLMGRTLAGAEITRILEAAAR